MSRTLFASIAALVVVASGTARAQSGLGIAAGWSVPTSDFGDAVNSGYHVTGLLHMAKKDSPIGIRLDGTFSEFDYKIAGLSDAKARLIYGTANIVLSATGGKGPYVIGGGGVYHSSAECTGCTSSSTNGGFNAGAGYRFALGSLSTFLEARYHMIPSGSDATTAGTKKTTSFIPISFGLIF
jgi:hypothetical protein